MLVGVLLPTVLLIALAALVARGVERIVPETMSGLALQFGLSSTILWLLSSAGFALIYAMRLPSAAVVASGGGSAHFAALGAQAALIWAPIIGLTVATAPGRWRSARW